jgi:hypothetical protein
LNKTGQTVAMPDALGFYLVSVARRAVAGLIFWQWDCRTKANATKAVFK